MTNKPIHYVPVAEQRYAEVIQNLEQHPARNQWSRSDRISLAIDLGKLDPSNVPIVAGDTLIPMDIARVHDLRDWLLFKVQDGLGYEPADLIDLLKSYVQSKDER